MFSTNLHRLSQNAICYILFFVFFNALALNELRRNVVFVEKEYHSIGVFISKSRHDKNLFHDNKVHFNHILFA
jgi:hypothetical protein